jgi:pimeloyl-ACP methyl ester carboxylesterase
MYDNKISMATLGGHGLGGKIALATACYHHERVTGYFGLDSTPMNQFYHESFTELRKCFGLLSSLNINRAYSAIVNALKDTVICPKWRTMFLNNLVKNEGGYTWNFNYEAIHQNFTRESPSNLTNWNSSVGLYPGRAMFAFPDNSQFVHLSTNTLPMYTVCPRLSGFNEDIFSIQGDDNPLSTSPFTQTTGSTSGRKT